MNRIYQGRVNRVQIGKSRSPEGERADKARTSKKSDLQWDDLPDWQDALWRHHELFQDAVNYYIAALAALGSSPESKLTRLRELLKPV